MSALFKKSDNSHIVAIIPARGGSKGIPQKNIRLLAGKPLIVYSIEQAIGSKAINRVLVSTDDPEIAAVSKQCGAEVIWRPANISGDTASSEDALLHALTFLEQEEGYRPSFVVLLQTTSPLRRPGDIDNAINKLIREKADSLLSLTKSVEFIWSKSGDEFVSTTFNYKNRKRRQELNPVYYENGSIYVFKPEILVKNNNRLGGKVTAYIMESWQRADIDDYESFEWCEWLYRKYLSEGSTENLSPNLD